MKRNLLLLIVLCCTMTMLAQNGKISYQAVVRDSENHLVYDTPLQVTVSLANSETGTAVYSEQHAVTSNANGLISLLIGDGQNKQGHWEDVQWNTAWVTATIRKASDQTFLAEHHLPLSAVPYALYADFADSVNLAVLQDYLDEHHYVTEDELPAVQANADWTETNPDTASYIKNKPDLNDYEKKSELCGDVKECIKDTLSKYTTTNQIDTLLGAYYDTTHTKSVISDTATALRAMMGDAAYNSKITLKKNNVELDSFRLNQQTDKAINIPVPTTVAELSDAGDYVTKEKLNDTLSKYTTSKKIDTLLDAYAKTEDLAYYELKEDLCGDVKNCIKDTLGKYTTSDQIDTLLGAYYDTTHTKSVISDTATALRNMMVDAANDGQLTIIAVGDTTRFTANQATNDTVRLNKFATKDTLNKYTTSDQIDTLLEAYATTEDLAYYERQDNLCRDVKDCIKDTLNHYTTSNQIDTLLRAYYDTTHTKSVISDTATALRNMMVDAANDGQLTIIAAGDTTRFTANQATNDTVRLNKFATKDTLNKYTTSDQIDTLLGAYAKTADLANYERQDNLCRDVKTCIKDTLSKYTTTNQLDTVIRKYDYATNTRVKNDSTWLQANIDTVSSHIRAIIPTVNDNAITIQVNGKDVGDFTLNQSSDETINVQHVVTDTAANTLTGKNTFTDTNYVQKRGFSFETPGKTTQESCQVMVNACDLLAIFDSLSRRIDTLQKNLNTLMNSVPPVFNSLTLSDTTATTMKVTADFSSPGTAITSYEFCYRRHDGVGGTQCVTSTTNEVVLTGLQPFTTYDFTASATNIAGTTPSDGAVIGRTYAKKPSGNLITEAVNPRAIKVTVEHLNFGGAPSGNVKICYKKKGTATQCSEDISDYGTPITFPVSLTADDDSTFARTIDNLEASELYCMVVELVNIDSTKVLGPQEKTSGGTVALEITSNANYGTLDVCEKPSVAAVYTAVPSEWPSKECTYQWEIVGTSVSQNTDTANHVEFNHTVGNYTISCTATHPTYGTVSNTYSITVTNTGHVPTFTLCSDSLQVNLSNILYADTIKWGDNTQEILSSNSASHPYQTSNNYTITANNSNGCVASKEIPVGVSTMHPCTVSSKQSNERGASETTIDSLQDVDGNWYAVAQIGNLCWMKSNLRTTHYSDGTEIANGTGTTAKNSVSDNVAYYYRPSSSTSSSNFAPSYDLNRYNFNTYGLYYNWKAVMRDATSSNEMPSGVQGVCPIGWHVPSEREWDTLVAFVQTLPNANYYDHQQVGYQHVLAGGCEWDPCNNGCPGCPTIARNSSEFTALPAGQAASIFSFNKNSGLSPQAAFFWTSTAVSPFAGSPQARNYTMYGSQRYIWKSESYNSFGFSVRCVRDYENATPTIKPTVTTEDATNVGIDTAKLNGSITIPDGVTIMAKGFKFKEASASEYNTEYLTGDELVYIVKGLTAGTEYTYRAFAIYDNGTEFGVEKSFTTQREPSVSTGDTSNVGMSSATLHGTVTNPDDATITAMGFEYKLSDATSYTSVSGSLDDNVLSANLEGLQPGQTYTYKAFITYNGQTVYGHDSTFKTKAVPTVTTSNVGFVGEKTAILNGTITNPDHVLITAKGFQWKLSSATGYTTTVPVDGDELVYNLSGLDPGTQYTYRTYITYVGETHYSTNEVSFTTKTEPTVYTETPININFTSATLKGTFSNVSSLNIEPVGFEWKETAAENFTNEVTSVTVTGDETAYVMSYDLSGLTAGKSYDYRAFITHAGVREYQNVVTFSTWTPPTVLTNSASGISTNTVTLNGTVNNPSGVIIAKRGFQYKADGDNSYTTIDTCTGEHFSAVITGLQANKAYHFRSFITYGSTTVYGNETDSTFTTKHEPTVVTNDETNLGTTTATLNGSVNNPDNVTITKGFEWKLKTADNYDTVYALGDDLTYDLANLTANTEYVFRAFVNFDGKTVYDNDSMFRTKIVPTVITNAASLIGESTARLNGTITNPDQVSINEKGFEWKNKLAANYTIETIQSDELVYHFTLSDLLAGTEYTYRSFITYSNGTIYGADVDFKTLAEPTVYTNDPTNVDFYSVTLNGTIFNENNLNLEPIGFEWKASSASNFTNEITVTGTALTYNLLELEAGTSYDYRAFITYAGCKKYGGIVTFSTLTPPTVLTNSASGISTNTATLNGTVNNPSNVIITAQGFEYKAEGEASYTTVSGTITENTLSATLSLQPNKTYYYRSFITYGGITVYGNETDSTFKTLISQPSLSISSNAPSTVSICSNGSVAVLYTAAVIDGGDTLGGYSYSWSIPDGLQYTVKDSNCTVIYAVSGTAYTVSCTATPIGGGASLPPAMKKDSVGHADGNTVPSLVICDACGGGDSDQFTVTVKSVTSGSQIQWYEGAVPKNVAVDSSYKYPPGSGIYTITLTKGNCSSTKRVALGNATLNPCTVSNRNDNYEKGSGSMIDSIKDVENHWYGVVQIGPQCWMRSNLRTTRFADGTEIDVEGSTAMNEAVFHYYRPTTTSATYMYDKTKYNINTFGLYYNWKAAMRGADSSTKVPSGVQGACPTGWHIPSRGEFDTLVKYVKIQAGNYYAHTLAAGCDWANSFYNSQSGKPLYYAQTNWGCSGFSARSVGCAGKNNNAVRFNYNYSSGLTNHQMSLFWTSEQYSNSNGYCCGINENTKTLVTDNWAKYMGFPIRCVRNPENSGPSITTENANNIGYTTATLNGTITNPNNETITSKGFEWKPNTASDYTSVVVDGDELTHNLTGLSNGTNYTYRAFIEYSGSTVYGNEVAFKTLTYPTVATNKAGSVGFNSASLSGTITNPDNITISSKGFEWKLSSATNFTIETVTGDDLTYDLTELSDGTEYVYKAFITYDNNTVYGSVDTFKTKTEPEVATNDATSIGENTATMNGTIINPDNVVVTKGFEWKLNSATDFTTETVTGNTLTFNLSGLTAATKYNYKAFVTFDNRTEYGELKTFTTADPTPALSITPNTSSPAVCSGGTTIVTYSASVTLAGTPLNDYTYSWDVPSNLQHTTTGNTCTVIFTSATTYSVTCTATPVSGDPIVKSANTTVGSISENAPTFTTCENDYSRSVEIKSQNNVSNFDWGGAGTLSGEEYTYSADGVYMITATNDNNNCTTTKMIALGLATTRPCAVTSHHTDNTVYTSTTGGFETENDEGKVLTVQDQSGHSYAVVQIGSQCWMRSNLRTTKFSDGTDIPNGTKSTDDIHYRSNSDPYLYKPVPGAGAYDSYDMQNYHEFTDGLYYNWVAAMNSAAGSTLNPSNVQGACPKGWHIPSDNEWSQMWSYVRTHPGAGWNGADQCVLMLVSGCDWTPNPYYYPGNYNSRFRNSSGFAVYPSGYVQVKFENNSGNNQSAKFWSSCQATDDDDKAYWWRFDCGDGLIVKSRTYKRDGHSVRCVRDE